MPSSRSPQRSLLRGASVASSNLRSRVQLPALKEVARAQIENWAKGAAVLHRYKKGEIVCEEGEFGSTAYYIVSGTVDIFKSGALAARHTANAARAKINP